MTEQSSFAGASDTGQPGPASINTVYGLPLEPLPPMGAPAQPAPCRCDGCKYDQRPPGTDAVLYSGPDAVLLMINGAIRDGRYEDIHGWLDERQHADHAKLDAAERQTRRTLAPAVQAWQRLRQIRTEAA